MPTQMAKFCREKAVLISVYEEKPRRRRVSASRHHHHHHHNHLHDASAGKGYNRRAELLHYSQTLRASPQRAEAVSTPLLPKPKPTPSNSQQPRAKAVVVQRKASSAKTPTCLGDWKVLIPSFVRSLISKGKKDKKIKKQSGSGTNKMKALMKSIKVQKKRGFIPRLCSTIQKYK